MKCPNCSHENPSGSKFCEECGSDISVRHETRHPKPHSIANQLDDILFVPQKRDHSTRNAILLLFAVFFCLGAAWVIIEVANQYHSANTTNSDNTTPQVSEQPTGFPTWDLKIENASVHWIGYQLYFRGVLKNVYGRGAKNVSVRIDLYSDQGLQNLIDTRYVSIPGVANNGAYSFDVPVYASPNGTFWTQYEIQSADYL